MRKCPILIAGVLVVLGATNAVAQTGVPPAPGRITVSINGGFQSSSQDFSRAFTFGLYDEEGQLASSQPDIEGGGLFDIGATGRVYGNFGAGIAYTLVTSSGDGTATGSFPHPLVFDRFRSFSASVSGLQHKEHGVHLAATWHIPFTETLDFTLSAGPSIFSVTQDFIVTGDIVDRVIAAEAPPFDTVNVSGVSVSSLKKTTVGFNIGADATYTVTQRFGAGIGVGVMMRYTRGDADFTVDNGEITVKAGGFQIGGGLRVRF